MNSQQFNRRITLQRPGGPAQYGHVADWEDVAQCWANIRTQSGAAAIAADAVNATARVSIRVRWREDVQPGMRALHAGRVYEIRAVLPDAAARQFVDLVCEAPH